MNLRRREFSEIEMPLKAIMKSNGTGVSLRGVLDNDRWLDPQEGEISLWWHTRGALAVAKAVARFEYPLVARPTTHYTLSLREMTKDLT